MKKVILFFSVIILSTALFAQNEDICYNPNLVKDTTKKSIKSIAKNTLAGTDVVINYHSPGARNRIIWGGLVPYDEVWVTGAHDATKISFNKDIIINNSLIPAGSYALFTIPSKKDWTVIINKNYNQQLASEYDQEDDVLRLKVKPKKTGHLERLQYFIEPGKSQNGTLAMAWEKIKIEVPFIITQ